MKCPFDLTNKKRIIEFEEKDSYNPQNIVKGYINRREGILYGALYITHVNGKKCPQVIYATPKMHYPFNRDKEKWEFPEANWIEVYEKLDGTNILSYNYEDSDSKIYLTYKTRLRPFLGEGKYGNFKALWNEMLEKYPEIKKYAFNSSHNLSFELYGKRNKILVDYDVSLETKLLFSVNKFGDGIVPPEYFVGNIPKIKLLRKIKMEDVSPEVYEKHQQEMEDELFVDEENHIIKGKEGTVWYFVLQGEKIIQMKCLDGRTVVKLPNKTKTIKEIVETKYKGKVLSYDIKSGRIVEKKIINWYKFQNDKDMIKITYEYMRKNCHTYITKDHKILTNKGYISHDGFNDDTLINTGEPYPNNDQKNILIGTLIGDSSISYNDLTSMKFTHSIKQMDYLNYILSSLGDFSKKNITIYNAKAKNKIYKSCKARTIKSNYFKYLRNEFYKENHERKIPEWFKLNPTILAFLHMDDGSLDKRKGKELITISCNRYNKNDVDKLIVELKKLGIIGKKRNYKKSFNGYRLYFDIKNSKKLSEIISSYVPKCMEYKLCKNHRGKTKYNFNKKNDVFWSKPIIKKSNDQKIVYCIDVEDTHNFLTLTTVVHNCKPPTILKYHWRGDAIAYESIYTTCINAFENFDEPSMIDVVLLLLEEFDEGMIEKSKIRIKKVLAKVTFDKKLQYEVVEKYSKLGIDINEDKGSVMRFFAKEYPKDQAKRIYTLLNAYVNKK